MAGEKAFALFFGCPFSSLLSKCVFSRCFLSIWELQYEWLSSTRLLMLPYIVHCTVLQPPPAPAPPVAGLYRVPPSETPSHEQLSGILRGGFLESSPSNISSIYWTTAIPFPTRQRLEPCGGFFSIFSQPWGSDTVEYSIVLLYAIVSAIPTLRVLFISY